MAFHVPFNQRASARHQAANSGPIYIGFDSPVSGRTKRKFNWWGFNGMWMSAASLLTAGFLSPIPLLISFVGLLRPGKKMATIGTVVSLAGILMASTIVLNVSTQKRERHTARRIRNTKALMAVAVNELKEYKAENAGFLPSGIDGNMLMLKHCDAWGESLRFDEERTHGLVRSAGPDREFDTFDDLTRKVVGFIADDSLLLPVGEDDAAKPSMKEDVKSESSEAF